MSWDVVVSDAELASARADAEARMGAENGSSNASIRRLSGGTTTNSKGNEVDAYAVVYTDLPFRLGGSERGGAGTRELRVGETSVQVAVRIGHFPASTANLRDGDLIDVTEGESAGRVLRIVEATWQDQATARRVPVVEVQRPEGLA